MLARDVLRAIEVSNELLGSVLSCVFIFALYRTSYFHGNLRSILYAFSVFLIGMNVTNVALVISTQLRGSYDRKTQMDAVTNDSRIVLEGIFERGATISSNLYWISFSIISIERSIATYFIEDYERRFQCCFSKLVAVSSIVLFYGFVLVIEGLTSRELAGGMSMIVHVLYNVIAFPILRRINLRYINISSSLSRKYQVAENVRATTVLFPVFLMWIASQWLIVVYVAVVLALHREEDHDVIAFFGAFVSSFTVALPVMLLKAECFRKTVNSIPLLSRLIGRKSDRQDSYNAAILDLAQQTELYFNNYAW